MRLAEALNIRAELQKQIAQLKERLQVNAKVQDGDSPSEDPQELLKQLDKNITLLEQLIQKINHTNNERNDQGMSLTDLLAKRDAMALKNSVLRDFLRAASEKIERYSNKEIKINSTVNVAKLQKTVDQNAKELRRLDMKIQELNWSTDLAGGEELEE